MEKPRIRVSAAPHIRAKENTGDIMLDVIIALAPAAVMGAYYFGFKAALVIAVSVASAVACEYLYRRFTKRSKTINDLSAVVTGLLLAFNLPSSVPLWVPVIGAAFAIIIVKQLFGGLGQNFLNPALGARVFLLVSFPAEMTNWALGVDGVTSATPLAMLKEGFTPGSSDLLNTFIGNVNGSIGEVCTAALLLGLVYLLVRRIISWRIPVTYMASFGVLAWLFGRNGFMTGNILYELCTGGLMLGAVFMATDYSTSPITPAGQLIMGVGCGVLTAVIRFFGGAPEGVSYAILFMNLTVPLIDRFVKGRIYGYRKEVKAHGNH